MAKTPLPASKTTAPTTTKSFAEIWKDYRFFLDSTNEVGRAGHAMAKVLEQQGPKGRPLRLLDFGAGQGDSLNAFLDAAELGKKDVGLSLIEHDAEQLKACVERFTPRSAAMIASGTKLAELPKSFQFDLITCSHVLYFVPKLRDALTELTAHLAPEGLLFVVIGGHGNALVRMWFEAFAAAGRPVPHHHGASVEVSLGKIAAPWTLQEIPVRLEFTDSPENRQRILRFLFGPDFSGLDRKKLASLFDPYAQGSNVCIEHTDWLFTVRKPVAPPPADKPAVG